MMPARASTLPHLQPDTSPRRRSAREWIDNTFFWIFWLIFSLSAHTLLLSGLVALYLTYQGRNRVRDTMSFHAPPLITAGDERMSDREVELLAPENPDIVPETPEEIDSQPVAETETPEDVGEPDNPDLDNIAELAPDNPLGAGSSPTAAVNDGPGNIGDGLVASNRFSEVLGDIRTRGLEVVFLFDATGSMNPHLREAKRTMQFLTGVIDVLVPKNRVGIGAYRDEGEEYVVDTGQRLTTDKDKVFSYMKSIVADGGRDEPEAVAEALMWAFEENEWSKQAYKVIVVIADAQGHRGHSYDNAVEHCVRFAREQRGQVNALITCRSDAATPGTMAHRALQFFGELTAQGGGSAVTFDQESELARKMLVLAFGREWEEDIESLYDQAMEMVDPEGHKHNIEETPVQKRLRYLEVLTELDPDPRDLEDAIQRLAPLLQEGDVPVLLDLVDHENDTVSYYAVKALRGRSFVPPDALALAIGGQLVKRPASMFWTFYVKQLQDIPSRAALDSLVRVLEEQTDAGHRDWAADTLNKLTGESHGKDSGAWRNWLKLQPVR